MIVVVIIITIITVTIMRSYECVNALGGQAKLMQQAQCAAREAGSVVVAHGG